MGSIPWSGRSPRKEMVTTPVFLPERSLRDRGTWQATVQRDAKSRIWLERLSKQANEECFKYSSDKAHFPNMLHKFKISLSWSTAMFMKSQLVYKIKIPSIWSWANDMWGSGMPRACWSPGQTSLQICLNGKLIILKESYLRNIWCKRDTLTLPSLSLKAANKSLTWKVHLLHREVEGTLFTREKLWGQVVCISKPCWYLVLSRIWLFCNPMVCPWNSLGKHTGVGCHSLLQGIIPTQGLNPGLPHCGQTLYCLCY